MKHVIYTLLIITGLSMTSCKNKYKPNYQYFPNMYEPVGYETYQESSAFPKGVEALIPPEGTIKRGGEIYLYEDNYEAYQKAKLELRNPLEANETSLEKGKRLYDIYCAICHGKKGAGQGTLVKREKFLGVPNYKDREITSGSIYHVIYYGINSMGSHAAQLSDTERWQVVMYVEQLRNELLK